MRPCRYPPGSTLVLDRVSDGQRSGGFTWHREAEGVEGNGLRGITYLELDGDGKIAYVQEGCEPLFKLDKLLEVLLKAANANKKEDTTKPPPSFERATPTTAEGIVRYLWEVAYPGGATPTEALAFFAEDIRYEDFNYRQPFVGLPAVSDGLDARDHALAKVRDRDRPVAIVVQRADQTCRSKAWVKRVGQIWGV